MFLFSFIDVIPSKPVFIVCAMITRLMEGIGAATIMAAGTSLLTTSFTTNLSRVMTLYSTFLGLGFLIGPLIGALFYSIGGYRLPFIAVGLIDSCLILFRCTARNDSDFQPPATNPQSLPEGDGL